jgi:hypothetical protein
MSTMTRLVSLATCVTVAACATTPPGAPTLQAEARQFMEGYARDLRAGDRDAIAARYDARGAYMVGRGMKALASSDSIRGIYRRAGWTAPARFEWRDPSYEAVGPDAILVTGRFDWTTSSGQTLPASYTALLVRRDGALRIRAEHEDVAPSALREQLCGR